MSNDTSRNEIARLFGQRLRQDWACHADIGAEDVPVMADAAFRAAVAAFDDRQKGKDKAARSKAAATLRKAGKKAGKK